MHSFWTGAKIPLRPPPVLGFDLQTHYIFSDRSSFAFDQVQYLALALIFRSSTRVAKFSPLSLPFSSRTLYI